MYESWLCSELHLATNQSAVSVRHVNYLAGSLVTSCLDLASLTQYVLPSAHPPVFPNLEESAHLKCNQPASSASEKVTLREGKPSMLVSVCRRQAPVHVCL